MTKRRHRRFELTHEYNNRAERRRGIRVTVFSGDTVLFEGRFKGYMKFMDQYQGDDR